MTASEREALIQELLEFDPAFRLLHDEHADCKRRIEELNHRSLLSQDDEAEEKKIKLHKLALKDQMEAALRQAAAARVAV
jgi:uncharacterized protein YdcH (DUF465 family)